MKYLIKVIGTMITAVMLSNFFVLASIHNHPEILKEPLVTNVYAIGIMYICCIAFIFWTLFDSTK